MLQVVSDGAKRTLSGEGLDDVAIIGVQKGVKI
jgi:hypothetical protein